MTARLRLLLEGKVRYVVGGLRQMGTERGVRGAKARALAEVANYLENNREWMRYDE